ncbi:hypothetical protein FACS1894111_08700 [Clostridia bacterium]|nr:hypothetical protein FACS1894111_08700 [Clostridia bacterium]
MLFIKPLGSYIGTEYERAIIEAITEFTCKDKNETMKPEGVEFI